MRTNKPNNQIQLDYVETVIRSAFVLRSKELKEISEQYEYKFFDKNIHPLKNNAFSVENIENALKNQLSEVQDELKEIISSHSILWWTILESRLAYYTIYSNNSGTIGLSRITLRIAILKYGQVESSDIDFKETQIIPKNLKVDDIVMLYMIDKLAFTAYMTTADLRNLWKGGSLRFEENVKEYGWNHSLETKEAIFWMDSRNNESGSILSSTGIFVSINLADLSKKVSLEYAPWNIIAIPNYNHKTQWNELPYSKLHSDIPFLHSSNLIFLPIDFESIEVGIKPLSSFFSNHYGFTTRQFLDVLILIAYRIKKLVDVNPSMIYQICNRGYVPVKNKEILIADIVSFWHSMAEESVGFASTPPEKREKIAKNVLDQFIFNASDESARSDIDILSRHPSPWLIEMENKTIMMDLRNLPYALDDFLYDAIVKCDENTGNDIRNLFPDLCWNQISLDNSRIKKMWDTNRILSANGVKRECDLSFIIDDVLLICECKARRTNFKKFVGEIGAMKNQWKDSKSDLDSVVTLSQFIFENKYEQSINIPKEIKYIVPLIIYPNVTWIPIKNSPNLIGKKIPRFLTPQELRKEARTNLKYFKRDLLTIKVT